MSIVSPTLENKRASMKLCEAIEEGDAHGGVIEDVRRVCFPDPGDPPGICLDDYIFQQFHYEGVTWCPGLNYTSLSDDVHSDFEANANIIISSTNHFCKVVPVYYVRESTRLLPTYILISMIDWKGARDTNCPWPGVLSFLKLLRTPFQQEFIASPDSPWSDGEATVRTIGAGAGNMTYVLLAETGHFVVKDQPVLAKKIVERWIENKPWFD
ncbi:uncharacterized protein ARMOST_01371 [Armillaria ostoyae]|uniref:Uncharacterized protein n=1 Tax=Armillaria ostoyae TaxID=47428 RepID=A0A284QNU4_ARMOS|nr:uncharacterized protein ARMOST_01371 [Armillaria ostoyae]